MSQYTPAGPTGPGASFGPPAPMPPNQRSWFARHKILTVLGALVALVVIVSLANGGGGESDDTALPAAATTAATVEAEQPAEQPTTEAPSEEPAPEQQAAAIGTPVRDGKFEFTVTGVETGVARVGNDVLGQEAQGQYVLLHVTVTNIGTEAQYFDGSSQKLLDSAGREFSSDSSAAIYLDESNSFLNQINPGNSVDGIVVFDVPADAVLVSAELHDSMFSGGVSVALG